MPEKTHWRKLYNPNYIGAWSLDDGKNGYKEVTATIAKIDTETITGTDGKRDDCGVAYFKENQISGVEMKPLVLNATMFKTLESLFKSPYKEDWEGRRITLYVERNVKAFGSVTDAIRIKKTLPREQGAPKCLDCGGEITATEKMNAAQVVAFGQKRYGKALCPKCLKKLMDAEKPETVTPAQTDTVGHGISGQGIGGHGDGITEPVTDFHEPTDPTESGESEFERMMKEGR
jgi:ribosomal protein L34E